MGFVEPYRKFWKCATVVRGWGHLARGEGLSRYVIVRRSRDLSDTEDELRGKRQTDLVSVKRKLQIEVPVDTGRVTE